MEAPLNFIYTEDSEPHRLRTREILKAHPEIRSFIGKTPLTFFFTLGLVLAQFAVAYLLRDASWWWVVGTAFVLGAFISHNLFVMIHECTHNLCFPKTYQNTLVAIFANLPQVIPSAVSFARYHIKHHAFQGIYELDADLPSKWEANLVKNSAVGKTLWFAMYPFFQVFRTFRLKEIAFIDKWILLNWAANFTAMALVVVFMGWHSFAFLLISFFFSIGLHPLGGRWVQEHYITSEGGQETFSYYGPLNKISFNIGLHVEHHDFPSVPWVNIHKVKASAPEYYDTLVSHKSWTGLILKFIFDPKLSLYSRQVRQDRAQVPLNDQSIPDRQIAAAQV